MDGHSTKKIKGAAMFSLICVMVIFSYIMLTEQRIVYVQPGHVQQLQDTNKFSQTHLNQEKSPDDKIKYKNKARDSETVNSIKSSTTTFVSLKKSKTIDTFADTGSQAVETNSAHASSYFVSTSTESFTTTAGEDDSSNLPVHNYDDVEHMYINSSQSKSSDSYDVIQTSRIRNIRNACSNKTLFQDKIYHGKFSTKYFRSMKYNFAYCKVPKSGSTFWMKIFSVLRNGVDVGARAFKKQRSKVHQQTTENISSFTSVKNNWLRTILVSRDPYSRLYSAFVDKSFLPLMSSINYKIKGQNVKTERRSKNATCPFDVTFQEFLDWVVRSGSSETLNRHWAPIVSLCRPCEVNSFILVKQESFSKDVEFALKQVSVSGDELDYIVSALHEHRAEFSLPGIIKTVFDTLSQSTVRTCLGYKGIAERTWHSFQIQGFIDKNIQFPINLFTESGSNGFSNGTYFTKIVLETIKQKPLTSSESKQQRLDFLLNAYRNIHENTIKGIQELYKQDFTIYGYSNKPPTREITE